MDTQFVQINQGMIRWAMYWAQMSIIENPVPDIYANDSPDSCGRSGVDKSILYRFEGVLGETIYALLYGFKVPERAFGAIDGQDHGRDYSVPGRPDLSVDVKTMKRKSTRFEPYYVFNLENRQVSKTGSLTDFYFCMSLIGNNPYAPECAAIHGYVTPDDVKKYGTFCPAGTYSNNDMGINLKHERDTYEIEIGKLSKPWYSKYLH